MEALQERDTQQAGLLPFQFGVILRLEPIRTHAASAVRRQRSTQRAGMLLREQGVILPRTMLMLCGHPWSGPYGKRLQEKSLCRFDRAGVAAIRALKETGRRRKAKQAP